MTYTIQVSNHPNAGARIPTHEADRSWKTIYDGPIASAREAREAVDKLSDWHRNVRVFKGAAVGKLHYGVFR